MIPRIIVVDKTGPRKGADIKKHHILVNNRNKKSLIDGLKIMLPETNFTVMNKEEFMRVMGKYRITGVKL